MLGWERCPACEHTRRHGAPPFLFHDITTHVQIYRMVVQIPFLVHIRTVIVEILAKDVILMLFILLTLLGSLATARSSAGATSSVWMSSHIGEDLTVVFISLLAMVCSNFVRGGRNKGEFRSDRKTGGATRLARWRFGMPCASQCGAISPKLSRSTMALEPSRYVTPSR